jgi:preprotein translocase subunit SecE
MRKLIQFLKDARLELKKVSWPSRKELMASTTLVIVVSIMAGLFLGILDVAFSRSVLWIIRLLSS